MQANAILAIMRHGDVVLITTCHVVPSTWVARAPRRGQELSFHRGGLRLQAFQDFGCQAALGEHLSGSSEPTNRAAEDMSRPGIEKDVVIAHFKVPTDPRHRRIYFKGRHIAGLFISREIVKPT